MLNGAIAGVSLPASPSTFELEVLARRTRTFLKDFVNSDPPATAGEDIEVLIVLLTIDDEEEETRCCLFLVIFCVMLIPGVEITVETRQKARMSI